jgi:FixJ family two-component response regulator
MIVESHFSKEFEPASVAEDEPLIVIVDDDAAMREGLAELLLSAGFQPICYASIAELLQGDVLDRHGCLILDVRMPGASGLDLQEHLVSRGNRKPIIFLTGYGDIPMSVQAMKAGAVDFLTKPVRDQTLLDAIVSAVAIDRLQRAEVAVVNRNLAHYKTLTSREVEVFRELVSGRLNKQIAYHLEISEVTVKLHRAKVMKKMQAAAIGELMRMWETLPESIRQPREAGAGSKTNEARFR